MKPFNYLMPESLDDAISMMASSQGQAWYIAGGTDVMPKIKDHQILPDTLISLNKIKDLDRIESDTKSGGLFIGARVTHRTLETSSMIKSDYPIIHDAVSNIGSLQVRNVATIGGNIANAAPSADGAVPLLTLDATVETFGPQGRSTMKIADFFKGPGQSHLKKSEVITRFIIPKQETLASGAYIKFSRRSAMEIPMVSVGVMLAMESDGRTCKTAKIGLGVAAPTPMRAKKAELFLIGQKISEALLDEAGEIAANESLVRDSVRGVAWHRREMIRVHVKRMGLKSLERIS